MYFAFGTPRILSERLSEGDGGFVPLSVVASNAPPAADDDDDDDEKQPATVVAIRKCPRATLFAAITFNSVSLWSIRCTPLDPDFEYACLRYIWRIAIPQPDVLLSKVTRTAETIKEDGENVDVVWKPDGSQLVILTNQGFLHFYDVADVGRVFEYSFTTAHHIARGPGEATASLSQALSFRLALEIDSGTQCGIGLEDELLICTNNPPSILSLLWSGDVNISGTISLEDMGIFSDPNDRTSIRASL
eukprot:jgi/Hompol1/2922/HPOL_006231-RA